MVKSPCTRKCSYNKDIDRCPSCWRTLEEIVRWKYLTDDEKKEVLLRIQTDEYKTQVNKYK